MSRLSSGDDPKHNGRNEIPHPDVIPEAKRATKAEHNMSLPQTLKMYPHAVGWSVLFSTYLVMEGYDNAL
jgi:SP family general alpha glucoside:H+ symporter-like MFS transporter